MNFNLDKIFKDAKNDSSLHSNLDINGLLQKALENDKHDYLENKTTATIKNEIYNELKDYFFEKDEFHDICEKLKDYVLITEIYELKKSHYIRYLKKDTKKLYSGGILVDVQFIDKGVYLGVLMRGRHYIHIKMDDYVIFQKLTPDEKLILLSFDCIEKFDASNYKKNI